MRLMTRWTRDEAAAGCVLALGAFDGLHIGHRMLMAKAQRIARERGLTWGVFTFANHPSTVLTGENGKKRLMGNMERLSALRDMGCDFVIQLQFTPALAAMEAEDFIKHLAQCYNPSHLVVGFNYRFGYRGAGDYHTLKEAGKRYNFTADVVPPITLGGETVSSTLIRSCIDSGEMQKAGALLGRPYELRGEVVHGREIGRTMNLPTANIVPPPSRQLPPRGVYIAQVWTDGVWHTAVTNIGSNPTVAQQGALSVESHLLDYKGDLYGRLIRVRFIKKLRGEVKFSGVAQLKAQIEKDVRIARAWEGLKI